MKKPKARYSTPTALPKHNRIDNASSKLNLETMKFDGGSDLFLVVFRSATKSQKRWTAQSTKRNEYEKKPLLSKSAAMQYRKGEGNSLRLVLQFPLRS